MKFKYKRRTVNQTDESVPEDRTHTLFFTEVMVAPMGTAASNIQLQLTEAQAAAYTIGNEYELALTPPE